MPDFICVCRQERLLSFCAGKYEHKDGWAKRRAK